MEGNHPKLKNLRKIQSEPKTACKTSKLTHFHIPVIKNWSDTVSEKWSIQRFQDQWRYIIASQIKEKPGTKQAKPETYLLFSDFYKNWKPNAINQKIHKLQWTPKPVFGTKSKTDLKTQCLHPKDTNSAFVEYMVLLHVKCFKVILLYWNPTVMMAYSVVNHDFVKKCFCLRWYLFLVMNQYYPSHIMKTWSQFIDNLMVSLSMILYSLIREWFCSSSTPLSSFCRITSSFQALMYPMDEMPHHCHQNLFLISYM